MRKTLRLLPPHVLLAHVDHALEAEQRTDGGRGHAVLAGAGLGDHARLAHAPREQNLAQAVVDLVRAGVQQVLALDVDARAAQRLGQPPGEVERRGPAGVVAQQVAAVRLWNAGSRRAVVVGLLQLSSGAMSVSGT